MLASPEQDGLSASAGTGSSDMLARAGAWAVRGQTTWRTVGPVIALTVGLALYTNSENSRYLSGANVQALLSTASILALIATGQTVLMVAGQFDLSSGYVAAALGVIASRLYLERIVTSELLVTAIVLAIGVMIGVIYGVITAYLDVSSFMLTLGGLSVFESVGYVLSQGRTLPVTLFSNLGSGQVFGVDITIVISIAVVIALAVILRVTKYGQFIRSTGSNRRAAFISGVPTRATIVGCFALNGLMVAGASCLLVAQLGAGDPSVGTSYALEAIAAAVLGGAALSGGRGSIIGTYIAVVLLSVIQTSLDFLGVSGFYVDMVFGVVLIAAVSATAASNLKRRVRM
jgi:ribose/xylose/arabinose/galactoside ABC-type transport system permease subunit